MKIPAPSSTRVSANTADDVNRRIRENAVQSVAATAQEGPDAIERRLAELDAEWDIERVLGTMAPIGILIGLGLGLTTRKRRFFAIPAAIATFLIVHGVQGWAPPLPVLRRRGVRTAEEIDEERYALRLLRGDFEGLPSGVGTHSSRIEDLMNAVKH